MWSATLPVVAFGGTPNASLKQPFATVGNGRQGQARVTPIEGGRRYAVVFVYEKSALICVICGFFKKSNQNQIELNRKMRLGFGSLWSPLEGVGGRGSLLCFKSLFANHCQPLPSLVGTGREIFPLPPSPYVKTPLSLMLTLVLTFKLLVINVVDFVDLYTRYMHSKGRGIVLVFGAFLKP